MRSTLHPLILLQSSPGDPWNPHFERVSVDIDHELDKIAAKSHAYEYLFLNVRTLFYSSCLRDLLMRIPRLVAFRMEELRPELVTGGVEELGYGRSFLCSTLSRT